MISSALYNPKKKQRNVWIEDRIWEMILLMKKQDQSISCYLRELIKKEWKDPTN